MSLQTTYYSNRTIELLEDKIIKITYPNSPERTYVGQWIDFQNSAASNGFGRAVDYNQPGDESVFFTEQHTFSLPIEVEVWVCPDGVDWGFFNVYVDDELRSAGHNYSSLPGIHPAELSTKVSMPAGTHTVRVAFTGGRSVYLDKVVYVARVPITLEIQ